jgi:AraC family transcriptional regulator, regulatory protein of adaptative response / DNA-3-methyladenine glycosylase II
VAEPDPIIRHRFAAPANHDLRRLLAFVGAHAVAGVESWDGHRYTASVRCRGGPAVVRLALPTTATPARARVSGPTPSGAVEAELYLSDSRDEPQLLQGIAHLLDLDLGGGLGEGRDPGPGRAFGPRARGHAAAHRALTTDQVLGPLVRRRPGLRVPGTLDPVQTLVRSVIGQQVSVAGARTVTARLVAALGDILPTTLRDVDPVVRQVFPDPWTLAEVDPAGGHLAMPRARARAVVAVAAACLDAGGLDAGRLDVGRARTAVLPGRADLLAVAGIGPWTADCVDLRARRDPDVLLDTDLAVRRMVERLAGPDARVADIGARWRPYRSLALMHLWAEYLGL